MIDEKKLLEFINSDEFILMIAKDPKPRQILTDFINNQSKIDAWIPCSGKMPHVGSAVLIQLSDEGYGITGDDGITFDISYLRTEENKWISSCGVYPFEEVVAWQPLPEPFKEEEIKA